MRILAFEKRLVLILAIVATCQSELVFAAEASKELAKTAEAVAKLASAEILNPLAKPNSMEQSEFILREAQSRALNRYLGEPSAQITEPQLALFENDFAQVLAAYGRIGFVEDTDAFAKWWVAHRPELLKRRTQMKTEMNLQEFFTAVYVIYKIDTTKAKENPKGLLEWMSKVIANPTIAWASSATVIGVVGVARFFYGMVYGGVVAGPVGGSIGAYVEPVARPVREKLAILGMKHLGGFGAYLNTKLFSQAAPDANADLSKMSESVIKAQEYILKMGLEINPIEMARSLATYSEAYNRSNMAMQKKLPSAYRDGRNYFMDATMFRPQLFSNVVTNAINAAETHRQSVDTLIDRIRSVSQHAASVEPTVSELSHLMREKFMAENLTTFKGNRAIDAIDFDIQNTKNRLHSLGATDAQMERMASLQKTVIVFERQAASALAAHTFHEFQMSEYNVEMPDNVKQMTETVRRNYGLDFFRAQFAEEVVSLLETLGMKTDVARKALTEAKPAAGAVAEASVSDKDKALRVAESSNQTPDAQRTTERIGELSVEKQTGESTGQGRAGDGKTSEPARPKHRVIDIFNRGIRK
jgi:hypothetical protein